MRVVDPEETTDEPADEKAGPSRRARLATIAVLVVTALAAVFLHTTAGLTADVAVGAALAGGALAATVLKQGSDRVAVAWVLVVLGINVVVTVSAPWVQVVSALVVLGLGVSMVRSSGTHDVAGPAADGPDRDG